MRTKILAVASSALLLVTATSPAALGDTDQTFVVDDGGDAADASPGDGDCATADGGCSLRAAIDEANASGLATSIRIDVDDVQLDAAILVTGEVAVDGGGATVTAAAGDRVLDVDGGTVLLRDATLVGNGEVAGNGGIVRATGADVTVAASALRGGTVVGDGASGGAIGATDSVLTVVDSTIADSSSVRAGGGIEAAGTDVVVRGSTLIGNDAGDAPGNGGGLHQGGQGSVDVVDSTVTGNVAQEGGGLWVSGSGVMIVTGTHVSGNTAVGTDLGRGGGGLFNDGGELVVSDSSVRDNTAPNGAGSGGGVLTEGVTTIVDTTIRGNSANRAGGGVEATSTDAPGSTTLRDVSLRGNSAGPEPGNGGGLHVTAANDVTVVDSDVRDNTATSEGGGLWNNAGSTMQVVGTHVRGNSADGADADTGGGGLFDNGGVMVVTDSVIRGNSATSGSGSGGGILTAGELTVTGTLLDNNQAARAGGGIEVVSDRATVISDSTFKSNDTGAAPGNGGALHVTTASEVQIIDSTVVANTAANEGGGLWNNAGTTMTVTGTRILRNVAYGTDATTGGGGLFNNGGVLVVSDSSVRGNDATQGSGSGGGIFTTGGELTVEDSTISYNEAARAGGGIEATADADEDGAVAAPGTTVLRNVELRNNDAGPAPGNGGGLHVTNANDATVADSLVRLNVAAREGGGLWNNAGSTMTVSGTSFSLNRGNGESADDGGGALFNNGGELIVTDSTFTNNKATQGSGSGGGVLNLEGELRISDSTLEANSSARAGGGIETVGGDTQLDDVTLSGNRAGDQPGNGGGLHTTGAGTVSIDDSTVTGNRASNEGGGLWNSSTGTMTVTDTEVCDNRAPIGPNVFTQPGGDFTVDGASVPESDNDLEFCDIEPGDDGDGEGDGETFEVTLGELNDSGASGTAEVTVTDTEVAIDIHVDGTSPNLPHAMHLHAVTAEDGTLTDSQCPPASAAGDADSPGGTLLTVLEGAPFYGGIQSSLTTTGDATADSALALDRFPVADDDGSFTYQRTFTIGQDITAALADSIAHAHIVVHGIDVSGNGDYADSTLPVLEGNEATLPALCGDINTTDDGEGDEGESYQLTLGELNDSGASGTAEVTVTDTEVAIDIHVDGTSPNLPHAMHLHAVTAEDGTLTDSQCPPASAAGDADSPGGTLLTVLEGAPFYGGIQSSLTTTGDATADSALALDRFPVADDDGSFTYQRTFTIGQDITAALADSIAHAHIVVHGIDVSGNGDYADSTLPVLEGNEATLPALCGDINTTDDGGTSTGDARGDEETVADNRATPVVDDGDDGDDGARERESKRDKAWRLFLKFLRALRGYEGAGHTYA